jgi:hypothetical protein
MQVLIYNDIEVPSTLKKQFDKVIDALQKNDFKTPEIKKMVNTGFALVNTMTKNIFLLPKSFQTTITLLRVFCVARWQTKKILPPSVTPIY